MLNNKNYKEVFSDLSNKKILIIGDIMLDKYYYGSVERISPESPVPIVNVNRSYLTLGGAGNVANNLAELGCNVFVSGVIGNDDNGENVNRLFEKEKIDYSGVIEGETETITKVRIIGLNQQMLRLDFEQIKDINEMIISKIIQWFDLNIFNSDCVIISDYNKGVCQQLLCNHIIDKCNKSNVPVIVDPKGNDWSKYCGASFVTPNVKELSQILNKQIDNKDKDIIENGLIIKEKYKIDNLLITRSDKGMTLIDNLENIHMHSEVKEVYDVSGAGDTVVALLAAMIACKLETKVAMYIANIAAGIAVSHHGTYVVKNEEILSYLNNENKKIVSLESLNDKLINLKSQDKKIVFTNGCFDILHRGHVTYLKKAKELGNILIIGLNSDSSVKLIKGPNRPINNEVDRAILLSALEFIDYIVIFEEETPERVLSYIKPDILVKGGDYKVEDVLGREYALDTMIIPFVEGYSSSETIKLMNEGN